MNKEEMIKRIRAATPQWDAITGGKKEKPVTNQPTGKHGKHGKHGNPNPKCDACDANALFGRSRTISYTPVRG